jgi:hypothetical protein
MNTSSAWLKWAMFYSAMASVAAGRDARYSPSRTNPDSNGKHGDGV